MQSPICDLLIRIKNGFRAGKKSIVAPSTKVNLNLLEIIKKNGYITDFSPNETDSIKKTVTIKLGNSPTKFNDVKIYSKPGRRMYSTVQSLPWGNTKNALVIVSTSSGLMSQRQAVQKNIGGEIIAQIW